MNSDDLKPYVIEALADGRALSCRWLKYRLYDMGVETSNQMIRQACEKLEKDGKIHRDGKFSRGIEWRLAVC